MTETEKYIPLPDPIPRGIQKYLLVGYKYDGRHLVLHKKDGTIWIVASPVQNLNRL
jgi:hypothetical protein